MLLKDNEAAKISGGSKVVIGIGIAVAAIGSFVFGLIDGLTNPKACNR